jgi:hypothetical protein
MSPKVLQKEVIYNHYYFIVAWQHFLENIQIPSHAQLFDYALRLDAETLLSQ